MILGVISFTIFVLNAEGYFDHKKKLFHELEFAHIVCFYIGLGLVVQGLALAIINCKNAKIISLTTFNLSDIFFSTCR